MPDPGLVRRRQWEIVQRELLEVFARHQLRVAVGLIGDGVAIRSQDARVDAINIGVPVAKPATAPRGDLIRVGDQMQSEASRLMEWAQDFRMGAMPYEVRQAVLGIEIAVKEWTELRKREGRQ